MSLDAKGWLGQIHALPLKQRVRIMNVCGGHERSITMAGLRSALPEAIELIPGPGCPVCVCPEEDIYQAMQLALHEPLTLVAFGDMLRVPVKSLCQSCWDIESFRLKMGRFPRRGRRSLDECEDKLARRWQRFVNRE